MSEKRKWKYSEIDDPETCDLEKLENEIYKLHDLSNFYNSKQDSFKRFINSVYGAMASQYFECCNIKIAESITLQGQDLNHFTENSMNSYFKGIFQNDVELHKKLGISTENAKKVTISGGRLTQTPPLTGKEFSYLDGDASLAVAGDTDSVSKDSIIRLNGVSMKIEDAWNEIAPYSRCIEKTEGHEVLRILSKQFYTMSWSPETKNPVEKKVQYIMRHKVSKERWKIRTKSGKEVIVTGDHSIMVMRDHNLISVKPCNMKISDKIVELGCLK